MKVEDMKLEYPHCLYNEKGDSKVVHSLEQHKELGPEWMPNSLRRQGKKPAPIEAAQVQKEKPSEIDHELVEKIVDAQVEAKPRGRRPKAKG